MRQAAQFHSKTPTVPFTTDIYTKRERAYDQLRQAVERRILPFYDQLEAVRERGWS